MHQNMGPKAVITKSAIKENVIYPIQCKKETVSHCCFRVKINISRLVITHWMAKLGAQTPTVRSGHVEPFSCSLE